MGKKGLEYKRGANGVGRFAGSFFHKSAPRFLKGEEGMENTWISKYKRKGYTEEYQFPGEYLLLVNPETLNRVRVYENGQIWEQGRTGEYVCVHRPDEER